MGSLFRTLLKIYRWTATVVQGSCRLSRSFVLAMPAISVDAESRLYWWHFTVIPYSAGPWPWLHVSGQRPPPTPHYYSCTNYHKTLAKKLLQLVDNQNSKAVFFITQCHIRKSCNLGDLPLHIQYGRKKCCCISSALRALGPYGFHHLSSSFFFVYWQQHLYIGVLSFYQYLPSLFLFSFSLVDPPF